ncbi:MAG: acyl--CoA ligase [Alphaproteobacteria bacterium]|nr:acyl--CoA ligase [Alphaproteobacteria bacterium]
MTDDFLSIPDRIHAHATAAPDAPALTQDGVTLSYAALDRAMDAVAAALQREGIAPTESISICAATSLNYATLFLGALRAGVAVAPLAPSSTPEALAGMVRDSGAKLFFLDAGVEAEMAPVLPGLSTRRVRLETLADWAGAGTPARVEIEPRWPFNIIYSSGTTGAPKGIVQSHAMRQHHVERANALGYGPGAVTLLSTPLYSNTTLVSFLPSLAHGGAVVLMAKFDAGAWLRLAQTVRATHTMLVPVQYTRLLAHPDFDATDLSSLQLKFCTSAPFSAAAKREVLDRMPGGLVEYFGMTEGGGTCVLVAHEWPDKLHTVGRPAPGHDIRLIGEDGVEVPVGEIGEIVGHSGATMSGYHNRPDATSAAIWVSPDGRRFVRTGDVGRFDADGFLTLMDRKKDMIISGGFNIYPSDIEAVLRELPEVADAAVVGVPSDKWGETPVAFVVSRGADAEAIRAAANARLGKTQRLAAVVLMDELPRSHIGKVLKRELRDGWTGRVD